MTKKALMVVSFGTSAPEAGYAITNIENVCRRAFPKYDFFRAFTSKMIIRKLKQTNPYVEANIFNSLSNVSVDTLIAYKQNGKVHHFLETYE